MAKDKRTPTKLTPKQLRFCTEYVATGNAREAYKRAGYSEATSARGSSAIMKSQLVKDKINELIARATSKKIADVIELKEHLTAIIREEETEEVIVTSYQDTYSENIIMRKKPAVKDRLVAINTLGKLLGAFDDRLRVQIEPIVIVDDIRDEGLVIDAEN